MFPKNVSVYFNHLDKLGLAGVFQQGNQEPLFAEADRKIRNGVRVRVKFGLSDFGKEFV